MKQSSPHLANPHLANPHLANPAMLNPLRNNRGPIQMIVETPKGSRNKYILRSRAKDLHPQPDLACWNGLPA